MIERIPQTVKGALTQQYADYISHLRKDGELYTLMERGLPTEYGVWKRRKGMFARVDVDAVSKTHKTGRLRHYSSKTPVAAEKWNGIREDYFGRNKDERDERIVGPKSTAFPIHGRRVDTRWKGGTIGQINNSNLHGHST